MASPEIRRALVALFIGTALIGVLSLGISALHGLQQGLLALLLFLIPSWALKGSGKTIDDMGVDLGPWPKTLLVSVLCIAVVYPLFTLGFHVFHTQVTGATAQWGLDGVKRFDESLLDAPQAPCDEARSRVHAWVAGDGLWVMAPAERRLEVDFGEEDVTIRRARCRDGTPRAGPARARAGGEVTVPPGGGMWLSLEGRDRFHLGLSSEGEALSEDEIQTGARAESSATESGVAGTRDWTWILAYLVVHLGIVALPEEWFFRGYLQTRLDERWGTPWTFLGAKLGWGFIASALWFALLHPILVPGAHRLLVFFPALLFGYLRARTGNIGAAVVIHGTSNLLQAILVGMYAWP